MKSKSILLIAVLFSLISSFYAQEDIEITTLKKIGDKLPSFRAVSLSGKEISTDELTGKVILINFWATWCPPCRAELPLLQKNIFEKIKDKNFVVMVISRGELKDTVQNFIAKNKYTFPVYLDTNKKIYELFANKYIPRNFVIGKDGKIKWASTGFKLEEFNNMIKLLGNELKN